VKTTIKITILFAAVILLLAPMAAVYAQPSGSGNSKERGHERLFVRPLLIGADLNWKETDIMQKLFHKILPLVFLGLLIQVVPILGQQMMAQQVTDPAANNGRGLNQSNNWAGYIATGGTFTSVSGSWTVPQVNTTGTSSDATWLGIGGAASNHLIQTGTQALVNNNGQVSYQAWYEMLPASSRKIPLSINPGDYITASIAMQSANKWTISLRDITTDQNYQTNVTYASPLSSAEWIEEMPVLGRSFIPLDNFGSVQFSALSAVKDGTALTPSQANAQSIVMVNNSGQALAQPSALGSDGASFTVNRTASTPTQIVSPFVRSGWRRVVRGVNGSHPSQSHSRGRFSGGFGQRSGEWLSNG
jgi:hypothetical protein